jgi:hypothetical protein
MASELGPARTLLAGVARAVITPPVGIRLCGYTVQEGCSRSVERALTATALVLSDGQTKVVLLACDVLFIQSPHAERMRERIGRRLNMPAGHVLLNASHTHSGPTFPGWQPEEAPEQAVLQQRYVGVLEETLVGVSAMAADQLRAVRIGAGKGSAPLGVNRRERLPDGRVVIGENPDGAVDREVGVIRLDDLTGRPLATVMSAGCHTVVLGPKSLLLSPDFVGPARTIVEAATGAPSLFLQGAAGNINPACGIGSGGAEQFDDLERLGAMLGGEVLKTWAQIRTHNRRGPRRVVQSVAAVSLWDYEPLPAECLMSFGVAGRRLTLPLAPLPDRAAAERQLQEHRRARDEARAANAPQGVQNVAQRLYEWAELVARTAAGGATRVTRDLQFWALRINDIGLVAVSGEPFAELGLEVKRRSPLPHTFFLGYSNGCIGYLPTPAAFAEGGMEVEESVRNYLLPAALSPAWGPVVVETSLELLHQLRGPFPKGD